MLTPTLTPKYSISQAKCPCLNFHLIYCILLSAMFSQKSMTPIDRQLSKKVVKIIHGLLMMEESAPFRKPVPHKALGLEDYKLIVKRPTDLNLIRRQNNQGKYKFVEEILDDIQLCWDNCKLYNAIDSEIYEQALHLEKAFDKFGNEILPDFWKDISREDYNSKFTQRKLEDEKTKKPEKNVKREKSIQQDYPSEQLGHSNKKGPAVNNSKQFQSEAYLQEQPKEVKNSPQLEDHQPQMQQHAPYSQPNVDKESMQLQGGEQGNQQTVQPILVNLNESPTKQQLLELSNTVKGLYQSGEYGLLEKVLEILHSNQKENMALNKNGLMTFKMSKIHSSTFLRIRKLLAHDQEMVALIQ